MYVVCLARDRVRNNTLTRAAHFFAKRLGIRRSNVNVVIYLQRGMIAKHELGASVSEVEPGLMMIVIDSRAPLATQLQYLAHEMVHVKQLLSGKLVRVAQGKSNRTRYYWSGKDLTHLPYHQKPWEREAMRKEVVLTYELFGALRLLEP